MSEAFERIQNFSGPGSLHYPGIEAIDMHTGGEPLRVVWKGYPGIMANSVIEYRRAFRDHHDIWRKRLIYEPRGHSDMYGVYLVPPNDDEADFGAVFFHNEGYSTMCGHAVIALGKLAVDMGWVDKQDGITGVLIDAPCGRIKLDVSVTDGKAGKVCFEGVPSFVVGSGNVEIDDLGTLPVTIAFGGAYYAYVDAQIAGLDLHGPVAPLIKYGMAIKAACMNDPRIRHPFEPDLSFLYGTIFTGGSAAEGILDRNVCIFANGEVDRSPTGSGVSGRMAILHSNDQLRIGDKVGIESITGSAFECSVLSTCDFGPYQAVVPGVCGEAFLTGRQTFLFDEEDPMQNGFLLD